MPEEKTIKAKCDECGHVNEIPVARIYDGFEGTFTCEECGAVLETFHEQVDE